MITLGQYIVPYSNNYIFCGFTHTIKMIRHRNEGTQCTKVTHKREEFRDITFYCMFNVTLLFLQCVYTVTSVASLTNGKFVSLLVLYLGAFKSDMNDTAVSQSISRLLDFNQLLHFFFSPTLYFFPLSFFTFSLYFFMYNITLPFHSPLQTQTKSSLLPVYR